MYIPFIEKEIAHCFLVCFVWLIKYMVLVLVPVGERKASMMCIKYLQVIPFYL